jgi:hypothetical protein
MVLSGRRFTSFDYGALRRRVAETTLRLRTLNAEPRQRMEAMAAFVSHHCVGLVCEHYHVQRRMDPSTTGQPPREPAGLQET